MDRPLVGEPLAVDLVNTRWRTSTGVADLFDEPDGVTGWLTAHGIAALPDLRVRVALATARDALLGAFRCDPAADDQLNGILARATVARSVADGAVVRRPLFADDAWRPAWLAVDDYTRILQQDGRASVRRCGNADCVLYFHDPTGRRRWCVMARCGNRAKARRHYDRQQSATTIEPVVID